MMPFKKRFRSLAATLLIGGGVVVAGPAQACSSEPYVGSTCITAANFCPADTYLAAEGQTLPVSEYPALFSLISTTFGGDGQTTFQLPDLRGRSVVGVGQGSGIVYNVTWGQRRGNETTTLGLAQLPQHDHAATFAPGGGQGGEVEVSIPVSSNNPDNTPTPDADYSYLAGSPAGGPPSAAIWSGEMNQATTIKGVTSSGGGGGTVAIGNAGGSQPFSNVPPQLGLTYCIAHTGIYPSRQ